MYIGRIQPGKTPADIKIRLQKQRPKNFKGHSIGCSDVIVITDDVLCQQRWFYHHSGISHEKPKALGDIRGVSYIYPILWRFGLIRVSEKTEKALMRKTG